MCRCTMSKQLGNEKGKRIWPCAKGKTFDDFEQFLQNYLGQLEGVGAPGVAQIRREATLYGGMDPHSRGVLLHRLAGALRRGDMTPQTPPQMPQTPPTGGQQSGSTFGAPAPPGGAPAVQQWRPPSAAPLVPPPPSRTAFRAQSPPQQQHGAPVQYTGQQQQQPPPPPPPPRQQAPAPARTGQRAKTGQSRRKEGEFGTSNFQSKWGSGGGGRVPAEAAPSGAPPAAAAAPRRALELPTVIVFDLETTGLSKDKNRIIEIAAVNISARIRRKYCLPHHQTDLAPSFLDFGGTYDVASNIWRAVNVGPEPRAHVHSGQPGAGPGVVQDNKSHGHHQQHGIGARRAVLRARRRADGGVR